MSKNHTLIINGKSSTIKTITSKNLSECGYSFFARLSLAKEQHHIYKLHKISGVFYWIAMWNSCEHNGGSDCGFKTIEDALTYTSITDLYRNNLDSIFMYSGLEVLSIKNLSNKGS